MRKLSLPHHDPISVYDTCVAAVKDISLQHIYTTNRPQILQAIDKFNAATQTVSWVTLPRVSRGNPDVIIAGSLTKDHLTNLYSKYLFTKGAPREIYDDIYIRNGDFCPFCGGLGQIHSLDHYLPKSNFPLYSVLPANLVPCCLDCNTGKNASFGNSIEEQTLHPYLDDNKYFKERWLFAEPTQTDPIVINFKCYPPSEWHSSDQLRVQRHFSAYKLASRFRIQAGAEVARLVDIRSKSLRILPAQSFRSYLLENANNDGYDLNGWSRTMYEGLAKTEWFLEKPTQKVTPT